MKFTLEKPNITLMHVIDALKFQSNNNTPTSDTLEIDMFIKKYLKSEYLYWDTFKYKKPLPKGLAKEELWHIIKTFRKSQLTQTVIKDEKSNFFSWAKLDYFEEFFHDLDMNTGGEIFVDKEEVNKANKQKYIIRGIMEEAIASSQLEGAATSRKVAKKMLLEGRKPRNASEQMIVNNYISMKAIEENYKDQVMSKDFILELHGMITKDTLDSENEKPRVRYNGEPVYVKDGTQKIYHVGPEMNFVQEELDSLIKFANDEPKNSPFIHPIIKAIMLHFWIGYLHPFTDGNGRLARLLFYWYVIRKGYWAFAYLPISKIIKRSPGQYKMAYVYSEQDDNDLTYFIDYNIKKIKVARIEFLEFLKNKFHENREMKKQSEIRYNLNLRQIQLLQYLYGAPDERTTLKAHMNINQIAKMTAITDLKKLVQEKFLAAKKQGRNVYYYGTKKIEELFDK